MARNLSLLKDALVMNDAQAVMVEYNEVSRVPVVKKQASRNLFVTILGAEEDNEEPNPAPSNIGYGLGSVFEEVRVQHIGCHL